MSTKALRPAGLTRSAPKVETKPVAETKRASASKAADMPWLSENGRAVLADAPEVSGPPAYKKPAGWR